MRRTTLTISLLLLLALLPGGREGVFAAASCMHAASSKATAEDHNCCPSHAEKSAGHCDADSSSSTATHKAMMEMGEGEERPTAGLVRESQPVEAYPGFAVGTAECLHCVSRSSLPPGFILTRAPGPEKRYAAALAPPAPKLIVRHSTPFAPALSARQHAPPGPPSRRHLFLAVFVI